MNPKSVSELNERLKLFYNRLRKGSLIQIGRPLFNIDLHDVNASICTGECSRQFPGRMERVCEEFGFTNSDLPLNLLVINKEHEADIDYYKIMCIINDKVGMLSLDEYKFTRLSYSIKILIP